MKNIILITIDDLRADHLGFMGYDKNVSPFLDKLANEGVFLNNFFSNAPYTTAAITSMLTSTLPLVPEEYIPFGKSRTSIATILKKEGLKILGVHSNPWFSLYGYGKDFDVFVDPLEEKNEKDGKNDTTYFNKIKKNIRNNLENKIRKLDSKHLNNKIERIGRNLKKIKELRSQSFSFPYAEAEEINKKVIETLEEEEDGFFFWIHYMDVHGPHFPKDSNPMEIERECISAIKEIITSRKKCTLKEKKLFNKFYDSDINYIDGEIESLFRELPNVCDLEETTIIITADHGEELGEHGGFGHDNPIKLYDELLKIPLIIWNCDKKLPDKNKLSSLLDISPTLLDMLDIEKHPSYFGESVFRTISEKETVISQGVENEDWGPNQIKTFESGEELSSLRTMDKKLIYSSKNKIEFFDLEKDPAEKTNIAKQEKKTSREMLDSLFKKLNHYQQLSSRHMLKQKIKKLNL